MKDLIAWMARHPVAANLLMGLILVAGVVNMLTMKQEVFPLIELDVLEVRVTYLGAAPDEVEEAIVQRIEEQIEGIDGIDQVTSVAVQGTGVVRIELARGVPVAGKLDEVKAAIDRITTFPVESERPEVKQLASRQRVGAARAGLSREGRARSHARHLARPGRAGARLRGLDRGAERRAARLRPHATGSRGDRAPLESRSAERRYQDSG
jgi:multidrug efflux pump subunit AcrB